MNFSKPIAKILAVSIFPRPEKMPEGYTYDGGFPPQQLRADSSVRIEKDMRLPVV